MPIRLSEYGTCYRYEKSGQLFGLMRVRSLQMNEAHIYCSRSQFKEEFINVCKMYLEYFELFNIEKYFIDFFSKNLKKIKKNNIKKDKDFEKNFDPCLGAIEIIKDGWETEAIPETSGKAIEKKRFFSRIFGVH